LQQGELSMVCVRLSERDLLQSQTSRGKFWRGQAKFLGGSGPSLAPPLPRGMFRVGLPDEFCKNTGHFVNIAISAVICDRNS